MNRSLLKMVAASFLLVVISASAYADETASYSLETEVKLLSDQRNRGISESFNQPAIQLGVQFAHESGVIALAQLTTVSRKVNLGSDGYALLLGSGYRFGDPEGWHFGLGVATEVFPGAKFDAPHSFDVNTGVAADVRTSKYNTSYALLEVGWGALEGRILNVISKNYRGVNTGSVCGTLLALSADPSKALDCYARGDHNSRGSWLLDLDYKLALTDRTSLKLHAGTQRIRNFKEANYSDYSIGLLHKRWDMNWSIEYVIPKTKVRELFQVVENNKIRAVDSNRLVLSVSRKF
ncbi:MULTISPECIES: TorF family putative porin [unclassified Variovorax]|uniref:TorF family putative porin n=1 Tax=unclassified Variovorax TaxID=663243 RepID=UPI0032E5EECC